MRFPAGILNTAFELTTYFFAEGRGELGLIKLFVLVGDGKKSVWRENGDNEREDLNCGPKVQFVVCIGEDGRVNI